LEFTRNKTGTFQVTAYHPTHTPYTLVKNSFPGLKMPYTFSGTYSNKETGVQWKVIKSSRQSFQLVMGTDTTSVRFISATTGLAGEDQLRLRIANGKVKEIFLNRQRLRNIRFSTAH
jgi:hypothetical protein